MAIPAKSDGATGWGDDYRAIVARVNALTDDATGKVPLTQLGSGTPSSGAFLRGDGTWIAVTLSDTSTPTAPSSPTIGTVTPGAPGSGQVSVAFTAPASNGGAAITSYTATSSPGGITASGTASPIVVSGLTAGTTYTFTVRAVNSVGTSAASSASAAVTLVGVPGAPTIGTAVAGSAGSGQVSVPFTAPASNGGSAITSYTVTASPGGTTATGTLSPITVSGLNPGSPYTFTVKATNVAGTGPASSASNTVTPPVATGGAPTGLGGTGVGTVPAATGINVKTAHGAVGNGTTDDGPAIRAAVAAAGVGGTVYFPAGTYRYVSTGALTLNGTKLLGNGQTSSIILWETPAWTPFAFAAGNNVSFHSLQIKRTTAQFVVMFPMQPFANWTFDNVLLDGNRDIDGGVSDVYCLQLGTNGTLSNTKWLNSTVKNFSQFPLFQASNQTGTVDGFEVRNCKFLNCYHTFLEFNAPSAIMQNLTVENNTFIGQYGPPAGGFGCGFANCKNVVVRYNYFEDCAQEGVHVEDRSSNIEIAYNQFVQCGKQHFSAGVQVVSGANDVRVRHNVIDGTGSKDAQYIAAISALRGGGPYPFNVLIDDNTIDKGTNRGIFHEVNGVTITNNRLTPNAVIDNAGSIGTITVTNNTVGTAWPAQFPGGTSPPPGGGSGTTPTISSVASFTSAGVKTVSASVGDTLVAFVGAENSDPTISGAVTWASRVTATGASYPHNITCFTGSVTTAGTQSITIGGSGTVDATIYVLAGAVTANATASGGGPGVTAQTIAGLTTTVANCLVLGMWGTQFGTTDATAGYTAPSGMTERVDARTDDFANFASYSEVIATASTVSRTATASNGGLGWSGALIALIA